MTSITFNQSSLETEFNQLAHPFDDPFMCEKKIETPHIPLKN
jgi:hypothetical protein